MVVLPRLALGVCRIVSLSRLAGGKRLVCATDAHVERRLYPVHAVHDS